MDRAQRALLLDLLSQPTAPYREQRVVEFVSRVLRDGRVPFFLDPVGNVVVGCASRADYLRRVRARTREPLRLYVAHMDHPGFHGVRWLGPGSLRVEWHGGAPTRHLQGANVWVADDDGRMHDGRMRTVRLTRSRRTIASADIHLNEPVMSATLKAETLYGGFRFRKPVWQSGRRLYTKAADDLVGAFALLMTARRLFRSRRRDVPFLGLLTRAEEVGFIGAIGHFELGWLKRATRPLLCISLETSRTLPGAHIGKGPVVRLGDRRTVFEPGALNVLTHVAERVLPGRYQRRIMDGGTCEATAATVYGLNAIGLSVPLGNYHNEGFEGGPDCRGHRGPAPEFVHLDDVSGLIELCQGLMAQGLPWSNPWAIERKDYRKRLAGSRRRL